MKNQSRAMKIAICVAVVLCALLLVVSSFASGICRDHDCAGEQCVICFCISIRENIFRPLSVAVAAAAVLAPASVIGIALGKEISDDFTDTTPVCLKVKLSN